MKIYLIMNKKILIGISVAVIVSAIIFVGLKTTLGDKVTEVPGEEHAENVLNIQEKNATSSQPAQNVSRSAESNESGP